MSWVAVSVPAGNGEWGSICPNTGVSRYNVVMDRERGIPKVVCTELFYKGGS